MPSSNVRVSATMLSNEESIESLIENAADSGVLAGSRGAVELDHHAVPVAC